MATRRRIGGRFGLPREEHVRSTRPDPANASEKLSIPVSVHQWWTIGAMRSEATTSLRRSVNARTKWGSANAVAATTRTGTIAAGREHPDAFGEQVEQRDEERVCFEPAV